MCPRTRSPSIVPSLSILNSSSAASPVAIAKCAAFCSPASSTKPRTRAFSLTDESQSCVRGSVFVVDDSSIDLSNAAASEKFTVSCP